MGKPLVPFTDGVANPAEYADACMMIAGRDPVRLVCTMAFTFTDGKMASQRAVTAEVRRQVNGRTTWKQLSSLMVAPSYETIMSWWGAALDNFWEGD